MYDLSMPAEAPGTCPKCKGTGQYSWGASINGVPRQTSALGWHMPSIPKCMTGTCFSCRGTGNQDNRQIKRNVAYNRFKISRIVAEG